MGQRLELQALLVDLLGSGNVYFQPPENVVMQYPAIVYSRDFVAIEHADSLPYKHKKRYSVTYIDANPDSDVNDKILALPTCSFDRHFTADNLNHDVYNIFF